MPGILGIVCGRDTEDLEVTQGCLSVRHGVSGPVSRLEGDSHVVAADPGAVPVAGVLVVPDRLLQVGHGIIEPTEILVEDPELAVCRGAVGGRASAGRSARACW